MAKIPMVLVKFNNEEELDAAIAKALDEDCQAIVVPAVGLVVTENPLVVLKLMHKLAKSTAEAKGEATTVLSAKDVRGRACIGFNLNTPQSIILYGVTEQQYQDSLPKDDPSVKRPN